MAVRFGFLTLFAGALVVGVACSDDAPGAELEAEPDGGPLPPIRAGAQTNGNDSSSPVYATMRFAHLASESGPIDFCYQVAGSGTFVGPVLGGQGLPPPSAADDAGDAADGSDDATDAADGSDGNTPMPTALAYGTVTKYLVLQAAGPITLGILQAGSTSCANPLARGEVTIDPGKLSTVALFSRPGDGGMALELASFTDDRAIENDKIRVRVIHGALGTSEDAPAGILAVRAISAKTTVLADRVEPRRASSINEALFVDGLGYVTAPPVAPKTAIAIGPATTDGGVDAGFEPWLSKPTDLALTGGSLHTAFLLPGIDGARFGVLWCADTTTDGDKTVCRWLR